MSFPARHVYLDTPARRSHRTEQTDGQAGVPIFVPAHQAPAGTPPRWRGQVRVNPPLGAVMSTVVMHNAVSVDGFIADAQDQVGPLFDWYANGDAELVEGGAMKVSQASADYVRAMWASIGSMVIGRHL